jgi:2-hydroxymuconate-semialdehyde hydrolase
MLTLPRCAAIVTASLSVLYVVGRRAIARVETVDDAALQPADGARFVETRSGRVHCIDVGQGAPVLLIHGSGRGIVDWQEGVVERLSANHRVIAFDCFGFGRSERNVRFTYGYDLWIRQAVDLLDALGVERVTVVGHSVGGALACMLAAYHPKRVDQVVTMGTGMAIEPAQFLPAIPGVG